MTGSVTKYTLKGSSRPHWRYRICVGKDPTGKYLYEGRGGFAKQAEAADAVRQHIQRLKERGALPPEVLGVLPKETLGKWLTHWLDTYAVDRCQPKTLERYRQLAKYVCASAAEEMTHLAQVPLSDLRRPQLRSAFYALLRSKGDRREHISARTVRHVASVVSVALNEAVEQELLPSNPMLRLKLPPVEVRDARSLTPEEIRALREACRGDWTFALVELALASAARRGELLALQWSDVDWGKRELFITKSLEQTAAGLRVKTTKSKKPRHFRLPQGAISALLFQRDQQVENRRLFGADYREHELIFCCPD
jgi:integrase